MIYRMVDGLNGQRLRTQRAAIMAKDPIVEKALLFAMVFAIIIGYNIVIFNCLAV